MKKILSIFLSLIIALGTFAMPVFATNETGASTLTQEYKINKVSGKTYLGLSSDWSKTWDSANFTEITDQDVIVNGNLTMIDGKIDLLTVNGNASIKKGNIGDMYVTGTTNIEDGKYKSITTNGNLIMEDGNVKKSVNVTGTATISDAKIEGSLTAPIINFSESEKAKVNGTINVSNKLILEGKDLTASKINGNDSATVELKDYNGSLPYLKNVNVLYVDDESKVKSDSQIHVNTLKIKDGGYLDADSEVETDSLQGDGELRIKSGNLTVHNDIDEDIEFNFKGTAKVNHVAFYTDEDVFDPDDYDYRKYTFSTKDYSDDMDKVIFKTVSENANQNDLDLMSFYDPNMTLDTTTANVLKGAKYSVLVKTISNIAPTKVSSSDTSIATVGNAIEYKGGYLYPIIGVNKGTATITIENKSMEINVYVSNIIIDTSNYSMAPGEKYYIGVTFNNLTKNDVNVFSNTNATEVQYYKKSGNMDLYVIKGKQLGDGMVSFKLKNGQSATIPINIKYGVKGGSSKRLTVYA